MTTQHIPGAEPFFLPGNHVGCLLTHGFTATPQEMRGLGTRLNAQGYAVLAPALAGHATKIEDILPTRWDDWYHTVTDAYDQLRERCDAIFLIGQSLGGVLSLHLAAHREARGVIAIAAPCAVDRASVLVFKLFPPLFRLIPTLKKNLARSDTQDPNVRASHIRYMEYPTLAGASMIRDLFPHVMDDLRDVNAPALLIQARGDRTIPRRSMETIYAKLGSRDKEMVWLERGGHLVTEDYDKEIAFDRITRFIHRHALTTIADWTGLRPRVASEPIPQ